MLAKENRFTGRVLVALLVLSACGAARGQHAGDLFPGYYVSTHQLGVAGFDPRTHEIYLTPTSIILQGWADSSPGFDHLIVAQGDFVPLQPGANIYLEVVTLDPAFRVVGPAPGFVIADAPGEQEALGNYQLHTHLTWHINSSDPTFDPDECVWHASFRLVDVGSTGYSPSAPIPFWFTNVPHATPTGDFDGDNDRDADDGAALAECLTGPGVRPSPDDPSITTCEVECLNAFDFDGDLDVDMIDQAEFARRVGH